MVVNPQTREIYFVPMDLATGGPGTSASTHQGVHFKDRHQHGEYDDEDDEPHADDQ
jgi:hypothetical protein